MHDLFISYSRVHKAIATQVNVALSNEGKDIWIDLENIPPSAEWLEEIYAGIEGANNFAFFISTASIQSEVCLLELSHAVKNNKRLIPIILEDVEHDQVPECLRVLNWINFQEKTDFDKNIQVLVTAIDTDLEWVKMHTRILQRATEWQKKNQNTSFTLRGIELENGIDWLSDCNENNRAPTQLQKEYLEASRLDAQKRKHRTAIGASAALIAIIVTAIVALLQWNNYKVKYHHQRWWLEVLHLEGAMLLS